jgi:hypothetical protein
VQHTDNDAIAQLRWGIRRYGALVLLCILACAALATAVESRRGSTYEASAVVVAKSAADLRPEILPRFGETTFDSGAVAAGLAADPRIGGDTDRLVPGQVSVETEQDSISYTVVGKNKDPERAALLANVAAGLYRDQLNMVAPNGARFDVQSWAQTPTEPTTGALPLWLTVALGALAGLVAGLGLVVLLLTLRRPVLEPARVRDALGAPLLGTLTLPRIGNGGFADPRRVSGLTPVLRRLVKGPVDTIAVVSPPGAEPARRQVAGVIALALSQVRPVWVLGLDTLVEAHKKIPMEAYRYQPSSEQEANTEITVVDGTGGGERLEPAPDENVRTVLVVPEGIPQKELRRSAEDFAEGELFGAILVRQGRSRAREQVAPAARPALDGRKASTARAVGGKAAEGRVAAGHAQT